MSEDHDVTHRDRSGYPRRDTARLSSTTLPTYCNIIPSCALQFQCATSFRDHSLALESPPFMKDDAERVTIEPLLHHTHAGARLPSRQMQLFLGQSAWKTQGLQLRDAHSLADPHRSIVAARFDHDLAAVRHASHSAWELRT